VRRTTETSACNTAQSLPYHALICSLTQGTSQINKVYHILDYIGLYMQIWDTSRSSPSLSSPSPFQVIVIAN
jgi:hypothetical protein